MKLALSIVLHIVAVAILTIVVLVVYAVATDDAAGLCKEFSACGKGK